MNSNGLTPAIGRGFVVVGTDTGVGKTRVACAILEGLRERGDDVAGFKPVETGTGDTAGIPMDAEALFVAAGRPESIRSLSTHGDHPACAVALPDPLAPLLAGRQAGREWSVETLDRAYDPLSRPGRVLVVEGAGGVLVELASGVFAHDLAVRWGLSVLLVVGNRLGAINHCLLGVEALASRGVRPVLVVLNELHEAPQTLAESLNRAEIERLLGNSGPPIFSFPWIGSRGEYASTRARLAEVLSGC